uniref:TraG N-terminal Proteobacteria domain-containing protein n=1 Tax=Thermosporothrix sp. COM3 TaxID=2490863 RepID=A0A455SIV2_9CHLR|nr:hypothetical protein KTC_22410 [Thermosporothrix sp. COM3]
MKKRRWLRLALLLLCLHGLFALFCLTTPAKAADPCSEGKATKVCLEGTSVSSSSYTGNDSKIQNPFPDNPLFFFTPYDITVDNPTVRLLWGGVLALVDMFLVISIMLNGIRVMLVGSVFRFADAVETLPGVLLALIVAHISLTFMTSAIGLGNMLTHSLYLSAKEINIEGPVKYGKSKTKEEKLHVFFPTGDPGKESEFEKKLLTDPFAVASAWGGPDGKIYGAPDGKSLTQSDLSHFGKDWTCKAKEINFDVESRKNLFGKKGKPEDGNVAFDISMRAESIEELGENVPASVITRLHQMVSQIETDVNQIENDALRWHTDWLKFDKELSGYEKKYLNYERQDANADHANRVKLTMSLLFKSNGTYIESMPGKRGDVITFTCQTPKPVEKKGLFETDLNFTDLFKNLQDLGKGVKMIVKVLTLILLVQMVVRLFFINLYIVLAPLGIGCWALPGRIGQSLTLEWMKGFLSTVFVQFLMVVALIVLQAIFNVVSDFASATPGTPVGGLSSDVWFDLMRIACIWFIIRIPSLLGTAPMRTMVSAGQMVTQVVGATVMMQIQQFQMIVQGASALVSAGLAFIR